MRIPQLTRIFTASYKQDKFFSPIASALQKGPNAKDISDKIQPLLPSFRFEHEILRKQNLCSTTAYQRNTTIGPRQSTRWTFLIHEKFLPAWTIPLEK